MIKKITLGRALLEDNQRIAQRNRLFLERKQILTIHIVASPGSGKTTLLLRTIETLQQHRIAIAAVEADPGQKKDAEQLQRLCIPVYSVGTSLCHLEAKDVEQAMAGLPLEPSSILFIENVGNLVCPAEYDLGQTRTVLLLSATEGEDKPLKYPPLVRKADLCLLTKMDVAKACGFQWEKAQEALKKINPLIEVLPIAVKTGQGFDDWISWLLQERDKVTSCVLAHP